MTIASQVLIGLATIFIGFVLGAAWRMSWQRVTYWKARRFWQPFIANDLKIVIGRFRELDSWEPTGLVGAGDMQAAAELVTFLDRLGFRRLGKSYSIVYHDELSGDLHGTDLICIGGPDANAVTRRMLDRISHTVIQGAAGGHVVSFDDSLTGDRYSPERGSGPGDDIAIDYGLLVLAPNPFDDRHRVMVVTGSFGYGTWAGIKLARSRDFLRDVRVSRGSALECLYKTEVIKQVPQSPEILFIRRI